MLCNSFVKGKEKALLQSGMLHSALQFPRCLIFLLLRRIQVVLELLALVLIILPSFRLHIFHIFHIFAPDFALKPRKRKT